MAVGKVLSVDPSGEWSPAQLRRVLEIIKPEADAMGMSLKVLDVTTLQQEVERHIIVVRCKRHRCRIQRDHACEQCLKEFGQ